MKITFTEIPQNEVTTVRIGGRDDYVGKLIRTGGYPNSPVWADDDLQYVLGAPFSHDGTMQEACDKVAAILRKGQD